MARLRTWRGALPLLLHLLLALALCCCARALDDDPDDESDSIALSKADIEELGLKDDPLRRQARAKPGRDTLTDTLKSLSLTDKELAELKHMERETLRDVPDTAVFHGSDDKRPVDAAPPPGMVAPPRAERDVPRPDQPDEHDAARKRAEAAEEKVAAVQKEVQESKREAEERKKEADALKAKVTLLTRTLEGQKEDAEAARMEMEQSRDAYEQKLEAERTEYHNEKEELNSAIEERKRAFDELYEEKQVLGQILDEEQKTLHDLQEKIQHPDLGLWIRQRAERAAILVETPETDAMKFYARKYMAPKVTKMRHRLALLEKRVEKSVDHLLPSQYGSVVALMLCIGLIGFPVFVTMSTVVTVTKSVSLRQYVLLGNVFLTAFSSGLCIAGILLQQDPLQTLYEASESMFVILQLAAAVVFPVFIGVIFCAVLKARDQEDLFVFGCELVFYILVGLNYRARVWRPAMLGRNIETSRMMYVVYVIDFLSMTALTISSAKVGQSRLPSFVGDSYVDVERDLSAGANKSDEAGGAGPRSSLGALGSGLMKAAISGDHSAGKEE
ncbi:unnamed protein product [Chondrus crispus]|uniref:Uncharacterized protein n=1 Tax=Chondrus crispus TaxID=2769 RepID=R7QQZ2_CHOCR|nr:unnamed protein product [Chondrus crispus]CDF40178.1 unnamed protein product [Chondrus crispus]|eukprot:XP_005710472.1 unnamed protein product [Chondrus crispus]